MKYIELDPISREQLADILESAEPLAIADALLRVTLHDSDLVFSERLCISMIQNENENICACAIQGLGNLARRFRSLDRDTLKQVVELAKNDLRQCVRTSLHDACDDFEIYLGWRF